jgi:uncharacterized protein DUF3883
MKFEELIQKRKQWVRSSKENNFDFDSILAGIYNDPSHFIYEILQNAEDAGAAEISLKLSHNRLEIIHNGKDFDFRDVDGITGIGISTKKEDINSIGKFGVGFKSVFAVTKTPIIHSGSFHFKIEDFVIPSLIDNNWINETLIVLPFNHPSRTEDEVFEIVSKKLESIGLKTLLFLKNIEEIKWQTPKKSGHYYKESNIFQNIENVQRVSIISKTAEDENFEEFLVIRKPIKIESHKLNVELAYSILTDESGKDVIVKEKNSKLIVFFPTEKVTYLNFLIQGPYKTTPNRENIPLDDEQNQHLIKETATLVADSISIIKELGLLKVSFLEVLPIDQNHTDEIVYSTIYENVKKKLASEEAFVPTSKNNFTNSKNALLARGKELTELLNENDIHILFSKEDWLDTNITSGKTRQLRDYLINELDVKEVDFEDFALNICEEFIERKTDNWLIDFYSRLLDQRALWAKRGYYSRNAGVLRNKPIIRLSGNTHSGNTHIVPCDRNNKIQVYLPSGTKSKYKTIKEVLTQNEESLKFLIELGLTKPDIFTEIKEFVIPKYIKSVPDVSIEEYIEDFEKLLVAFQKEDSEKKKELISDLKDLYIIHSVKYLTGESQFRKPDEVYLKSEDLVEYFKGYDCVFFVSDELYQGFTDNKDVLIDFLLNIGCENKPKRFQIKPDLSYEDKKKLRDNSGFTREIHTIDYNYEGLEKYLPEITKEKSYALWNFLIKSLASKSRWEKYDFFKGEYSWFYYSQHYKKFESKFLKTLKNTPWIFDKNDNIVLPKEISLSALPDCYAKDDENVEILINVLGFQIDEIKRIEKKYGGVYVTAEEKEKYEKFLKWEAEQSKQEENKKSENDDKWIPEIEPESILPKVEGIEPDIIETPDYRGQRPADNSTEKNEVFTETDAQEKLREERSKKQLKDIGNWGERFVCKHLQEQFADEANAEIIWLNKDSDVGKGYDFSIVSDNREIQYIEVKSKIDEAPQLFEITGTQWEFARKLYNENEGDKYKIYIVSNTGTGNAKIGIIKNPTKLWKEGKLYAHPVHFKL